VSSSDRLRPAQSELGRFLASGRGAFLGMGLMTALINVLYLTGSFFMLEVYDRVLPSRSIPTLIGLGVLALGLYAVQGALDLIRGRVLVRIGAALDHALSARVFGIVVRLPLHTRNQGDGQQPLRDLDQVRSFLSGAGPAAFFDLPWMPLYVGICFLFHPWIGWAALAGAGLLITLTLLTDGLTRAPAKSTVAHAQTRNVLAEASRRNAEVLQAMGMAGRMNALWAEANAQYMQSQQRTSDVAGGLGALSKVFRMALQSGVLALGAYLVIQQEATAGIIIASSILTARALAPVGLAIANWKGFVAARQSWARLKGHRQLGAGLGGEGCDG
jgi:ABC-type protease/lipase transport system fused ATPase/permease subunit